MHKPKVFVSFNYENDRHYKFLLSAWSSNSNFDFVFDDRTPTEIKTDSVSVVKSVLSRTINESTYTLVLVGEYANAPHKDRKEIGFINWINFEAATSYYAGNKLVAVCLAPGNSVPQELVGKPVSWAWSFDEVEILRALESAK